MKKISLLPLVITALIFCVSCSKDSKSQSGFIYVTTSSTDLDINGLRENKYFININNISYIQENSVTSETKTGFSTRIYMVETGGTNDIISVKESLEELMEMIKNAR